MNVGMYEVSVADVAEALMTSKVLRESLRKCFGIQYVMSERTSYDSQDDSDICAVATDSECIPIATRLPRDNEQLEGHDVSAPCESRQCSQDGDTTSTREEKLKPSVTDTQSPTMPPSIGREFGRNAGMSPLPSTPIMPTLIESVNFSHINSDKDDIDAGDDVLFTSTPIMQEIPTTVKKKDKPFNVYDNEDASCISRKTVEYGTPADPSAPSPFKTPGVSLKKQSFFGDGSCKVYSNRNKVNSLIMQDRAVIERLALDEEKGTSNRTNDGAFKRENDIGISDQHDTLLRNLYADRNIALEQPTTTNELKNIGDDNVEFELMEGEDVDVARMLVLSPTNSPFQSSTPRQNKVFIQSNTKMSRQSRLKPRDSALKENNMQSYHS